MTSPIRIQRKRTKGWRMPANTVHVGRGSKWGNPWKVSREPANAARSARWLVKADHEAFAHPEWTKRDAQARAVELFKQAGIARLSESDRAELRGKNLACWCAPDQPCHADVLLELANRADK